MNIYDWPLRATGQRNRSKMFVLHTIRVTIDTCVQTSWPVTGTSTGDNQENHPSQQCILDVYTRVATLESNPLLEF